MMVPLPGLGETEDVSLHEQKWNGRGWGSLWEPNSLCCLETLKIYMRLKKCSSDPRHPPNFQIFIPQFSGTYFLIN